MTVNKSDDYKQGFVEAVIIAHGMCGPFIRNAKTVEAAQTAAAIANLIFNMVEVKPDG